MSSGILLSDFLLRLGGGFSCDEKFLPGHAKLVFIRIRLSDGHKTGKLAVDKEKHQLG